MATKKTAKTKVSVEKLKHSPHLLLPYYHEYVEASELTNEDEKKSEAIGCLVKKYGCDRHALQRAISRDAEKKDKDKSDGHMILTSTQEQELAIICRVLSNRGYDPSRRFVQDLAASVYGLKRLSNNWYNRFMQRSSNLIHTSTAKPVPSKRSDPKILDRLDVWLEEYAEYHKTVAVTEATAINADATVMFWTGERLRCHRAVSIDKISASSNYGRKLGSLQPFVSPKHGALLLAFCWKASSAKSKSVKIYFPARDKTTRAATAGHGLEQLHFFNKTGSFDESMFIAMIEKLAELKSLYASADLLQTIFVDNAAYQVSDEVMTVALKHKFVIYPMCAWTSMKLAPLDNLSFAKFKNEAHSLIVDGHISDIVDKTDAQEIVAIAMFDTFGNAFDAETVTKSFKEVALLPYDPVLAKQLMATVVRPSSSSSSTTVAKQVDEFVARATTSLNAAVDEIARKTKNVQGLRVKLAGGRFGLTTTAAQQLVETETTTTTTMKRKAKRSLEKKTKPKKRKKARRKVESRGSESSDTAEWSDDERTTTTTRTRRVRTITAAPKQPTTLSTLAEEYISTDKQSGDVKGFAVLSESEHEKYYERAHEARLLQWYGDGSAVRKPGQMPSRYLE